MSLSTNIDYVEFDENDPVFKEINKFLYEIQPKMRSESTYFVPWLTLCTERREEKCTSGPGKVGTVNPNCTRLEQCMGEYAANISVSYITQKRAASNSASPEMVKAIGRRFVVFKSQKRMSVSTPV